MEENIKIGNFTYNQDNKGNWLWKSDQFKPFKKNGNLKAQYHDLPRFKVITEFEDREVKDFQNLLEQSVKDISLKLLSFSK